MAVIFDGTPIYRILGDGRLIQDGLHHDDGTDKFYVGGKIYYIDETATGAEYTFYSRTGKIITDVQVGDEPYAYKRVGTPNKDKYYILNETRIHQKYWTYKDSSGNWVYNNLGTQRGIGTGRTNTAKVLAADNGAYAAFTDSIWYDVTQFNNNAYNGCTDWYITSNGEITAAKNAVDRDGNKVYNLDQYLSFSSSELDAQLVYNINAGFSYKNNNNYYGSPCYAGRSM